MLATKLSKYGENLIKNEIVNRWGFREQEIKVSIVIDENSNMCEVIVHEKPKKGYIPLGIYDDCFSSSRVKEVNIPYPLFDQIGVLVDENKRDYYIRALAEFAEEVSHPIIDCIAKFIPDFNWTSILDKEVLEKSFFDVLVQTKKGLIDISETEEIVKKINAVIWEKIIPQENEIIGTDSLGRNYSRLIRKHSTVAFPGRQKPRLITEKAYRENYYWNEDEPRICTISPESELYITIGTDYLINHSSMLIGGRRYALIDIDRNFQISFDWNAKRFAQFYGTEINSYVEWLLFKNSFINKAKGIKLSYIEFDNASGARISTYKINSYTETETEIKIQNILKWVEMNTFWDGKEAKSYGNLLRQIIQKKSGMERKNITFGKASECWAFNNEFSRFLSNVINGNYTTISEELVIPLFEESISSEKPLQNIQIIKLLSRIQKNNHNINFLRKTISFRYGELAAYAFLYEKRDKEYRIRDELYSFRNNPTEWSRNLREKIESQDPYNKKDFIKVRLAGLFVSKLVEIEALTKGVITKLDGDFFVGFDITVEDYFKDGIKGSEVDSILKLFNPDCLEVKKIDQDYELGLKEDEVISYRIIFEEYKRKVK